MFEDRKSAGQALAKSLTKYAGRDAIVIALPRGGVPVAAPIAEALGAPLDILMVRKIGAPGQPELAAGAVTEGDPPNLAINKDIVRYLGISDQYLETTSQSLLAAMAKRRAAMGAAESVRNLADQSVILVDDGVATGATVKAAIGALRAQKIAHLCLAVPVASPETAAVLQGLVDDFVCLEQPSFFQAVGAHYRVFDQVETSAVAAILNRH